MNDIKKRNNRIPIVIYSDTYYEIKCPICKKSITLDELENENRCHYCNTYWNKYAKKLLPFYYRWSFKLLKEYWGE